MIAGIFADSFYVIAASGFAAFVTLGVLVGRRALGVVGRRAELESTKLDIDLDKLKHTREIQRFNQHNTLVQLTAGSEAEREELRKKDEEKRRAADAKPETVKPDLVTSKVDYRTREQWEEERGMKDGEWVPSS